jgi:hypothetical protein
LPKELLDGVKSGMEALGLFALVSIGGDGSLTIAQQLHEHGIPLVGVPKTIDNDLAGTLLTFGFDSAVACATMPSTVCTRPPKAMIASWSSKSWAVMPVGFAALRWRRRRRGRDSHPRDPLRL